MIDSELCNSQNYKNGIIEFDSKKFTEEVKKITKEKNINQEQLLNTLEENTGFSVSKIKRWKSGKKKPQYWDDIEKLCDVLEICPESLMKSCYQDKIYERYMEAREVAKSNVVSDTDEYFDYLKSFCEFFDLIDDYLKNININFEKVNETIRKLYKYSSQKRNERIQLEKEKERKNMEEKIRIEQEKRLEVERKYQANFNKHAFLGKDKIKLQCMLPCISAYICSVAFLGANSIFNIVISVLALMLFLIFIFANMFFKTAVKKEYYENYEDRDTHFLLCSMIFPVVTFLLMFFNSFEVNNDFFDKIYFIIDCVYILFAVFTEIVFLKNIDCLSRKK